MTIKYYTPMLERSLTLAMHAFRGMYRKYNRMPAIVHAIDVHDEVSKYFQIYDPNNRLRENIECAAYLHDVLEDCRHIKEGDITIATNGHVLQLIKEITNPSKAFPNLSREERKFMDRQHLKYASNEAKIIKLVDRRCNLQNIIDDIKIVNKDFVKLYADESRLLLDSLCGTVLELEENLIETIEDVYTYVKE